MNTNTYEEKYYKYKGKYLKLKMQSGGDIIKNQLADCSKNCGRMTNGSYTICCPACTGKMADNLHTPLCNNRNLQSMKISFDQKTSIDINRKSVNIAIWSKLHEICMNVHNKLGLLGCGDPHGFTPTSPIFHAELVNSRVTTPLNPQQQSIKNANYVKYDGKRINLMLKSNWQCIGNAFGLIIDSNGSDGSNSKQIHITIGFCQSGCNLSSCHSAVESALGIKLI